MTTTTTRQTAAARIRQALKLALAVTPRQVSVRDTSGSLDSSVCVTVKDPTVSLGDVRAVAERFQSVRRCEIVGDILGGGNTFVHVDYAPEALAARSAALVPAVEAAFAQLVAQDGGSAPVAGTPLELHRTHGPDYHVWDADAHRGCIWGGCSAAEVAGHLQRVLDCGSAS